MKVLLDTNAYVAMKRGEPRIAERVRDAETVLLSLFVVGELMFGFRNGSRYERNRAELMSFLEQTDVDLALPTWVTADRFARVSAQLRRKGTPIPTNDVWIAAQVFETGSELLTFDRRFERVDGLTSTVFDLA